VIQLNDVTFARHHLRGNAFDDVSTFMDVLFLSLSQRGVLHMI
jgi:hypothetical protein